MVYSHSAHQYQKSYLVWGTISHYYEVPSTCTVCMHVCICMYCAQYAYIPCCVCIEGGCAKYVHFLLCSCLCTDRVSSAVSAVGVPVLNGGFSTFLAFVLVAFSSSYAFQAFFKVSFFAACVSKRAFNLV